VLVGWKKKWVEGGEEEISKAHMRRRDADQVTAKHGDLDENPSSQECLDL